MSHPNSHRVDEKNARRVTRLPTMELVSSPDSDTTISSASSKLEKPELATRSIPPERYEHQQRTLSTLVLAGTFMAGVEGQILSIILSLQGNGSRLRTGALCFAILGVVTTSFSALYAAATYIWLRNTWKEGPKKFHEWVAACVGMLIRWCSSFLIAGTYSGFFALILYFFQSSTVAVAVFASVIVFLSGLFPMIWGLYYWIGLNQGWLVWTPEFHYPVRTSTLPPQSRGRDLESN
ncbi:hypothetical protein C8J56DRAFT_1171473 [Mycena floridula]|nr:hypothetical protein C8J56DRAFT_1171473 [Mycena floridula]